MDFPGTNWRWRIIRRVDAQRHKRPESAPALTRAGAFCVTDQTSTGVPVAITRARLATVDQLLRKALAVLDAAGSPDDFNNLADAISRINSLSASVSNGLRSILKFEGAAFVASL
jgi:hypothetical protein